MLLIPVTVSGGTATSVELRNAWQRAWAQFRTSQSPIDYVRVSGIGVDPLLVNAAQTTRPGRGWWRNLLDLYGAADILVAEVQLQRLYPGGPARARFIGRHGPDNEIIGGFTLTAANSDAIPAMMAEGVQRMDELFADGARRRPAASRPDLDLPAPPPLAGDWSTQPPKPPSAGQCLPGPDRGNDVNTYNFAMAHLRTLGGIEPVIPQSINPERHQLCAGHLSRRARAARRGAGGARLDRRDVRARSSGCRAGKPPPLPPPPHSRSRRRRRSPPQPTAARAPQ